MDHMERVIKGGMWTFDHYLLITKILKEDENPPATPLNMIGIWVQIYAMPNGLALNRRELFRM